MTHQPDAEDRLFCERFERCELPSAALDHRGHLRVAYVALCARDLGDAHGWIKAALLRFLAHCGAPSTKYHETLTVAWLAAVRDAMNATPHAASFADFLDASPHLLRADLLGAHYSDALLKSDRARCEVVAPDRAPIPGLTSRWID